MEKWPSGLQLYEKETPTQVFSCEHCEIFNNNYFEEHLRTAASVPSLGYRSVLGTSFKPELCFAEIVNNYETTTIFAKKV